MQLNKTQIKKINLTKDWFKEKGEFTIDTIKRFNAKFAKDDVVWVYIFLYSSFKNHSNFLKVKTFVDSDFYDRQKNYIKLAKLLKQFVKSFNLK